jgi:hypothetical protein
MNDDVKSRWSFLSVHVSRRPLPRPDADGSKEAGDTYRKVAKGSRSGGDVKVGAHEAQRDQVG